MSQIWNCLEKGPNLIVDHNLSFRRPIAIILNPPLYRKDFPISIGSNTHLQLPDLNIIFIWNDILVSLNSQLFLSHQHFITRCVGEIPSHSHLLVAKPPCFRMKSHRNWNVSIKAGISPPCFWQTPPFFTSLFFHFFSTKQPSVRSTPHHLAVAAPGEYHTWWKKASLYEHSGHHCAKMEKKQLLALDFLYSCSSNQRKHDIQWYEPCGSMWKCHLARVYPSVFHWLLSPAAVLPR